MTTEDEKQTPATSDTLRSTGDADKRSRGAAFTLIEMLAAIAILAIMIVLLFAAFSQASRAWLQGENRVETFTQARAALDFMSKELSQAIASTNVPFVANNDSLAFVAPVNASTNPVDLTEIVYRLDYVTNPTPPRKLIRRASYYGSGNWDFYNFAANGNWPASYDAVNTGVLAENIVLLQFRFTDINGSCLGSQCYFDYWNSTALNNQWGSELPSSVGACSVPGQPPCTYMTNRAPAGVFISLGVIDSKSAARLAAGASFASVTNQSMQVFTTFVAIPNRQP